MSSSELLTEKTTLTLGIYSLSCIRIVQSVSALTSQTRQHNNSQAMIYRLKLPAVPLKLNRLSPCSLHDGRVFGTHCSSNGSSSSSNDEYRDRSVRPSISVYHCTLHRNRRPCSDAQDAIQMQDRNELTDGTLAIRNHNAGTKELAYKAVSFNNWTQVVERIIDGWRRRSWYVSQKANWNWTKNAYKTRDIKNRSHSQ